MSTADLHNVDLDATAVASRSNGHERDGWSYVRTIKAAERMVRKSVVHAAEGRTGLAELAALAHLRRDLDDVIDDNVHHLLTHDDASHREIAAALGISRQAAQKRYPGRGRRRGGQEVRLR